jgi:hypothetical protein
MADGAVQGLRMAKAGHTPESTSSRALTGK